MDRIKLGVQPSVGICFESVQLHSPDVNLTLLQVRSQENTCPVDNPYLLSLSTMLS